jgi:hypothetical protein
MEIRDMPKLQSPFVREKNEKGDYVVTPVIEELSRNGRMWDHPHTTSAERQIVLIQEALRRILQHQIDYNKNRCD